MSSPRLMGGIDENGNLVAIAVALDGTVQVSGSLETNYSVSIASIQTNATGTNFNVFPSTQCKQIILANNTSVDIEYQRLGVGSAFPIPAQSAKTITGITNASQIGIRRIDQSNTQISLAAELINY
jgi:hypothetical protein